MSTMNAKQCDYAAHLIHVDRARAIIGAHGHKAHMTQEGLLCLSAVVWCEGYGPKAAHEDDDRLFDEPTVFPIDAAGMVDRKAVRAWLGY